MSHCGRIITQTDSDVETIRKELGNALVSLKKNFLEKSKMNDSKDNFKKTQAASGPDLHSYASLQACRVKLYGKRGTKFQASGPQWLDFCGLQMPFAKSDVHPAGAIRIHVRAPYPMRRKKRRPILRGMEAGWKQSLERLDSWIVKNIDGNSVLQRSLRTNLKKVKS